jgi:hypothetical protein
MSGPGVLRNGYGSSRYQKSLGGGLPCPGALHHLHLLHDLCCLARVCADRISPSDLLRGFSVSGLSAQEQYLTPSLLSSLQRRQWYPYLARSQGGMLNLLGLSLQGRHGASPTQLQPLLAGPGSHRGRRERPSRRLWLPKLPRIAIQVTRITFGRPEFQFKRLEFELE